MATQLATASLPCSSRNSSVSALRERLAARPQAARQHGALAPERKPTLSGLVRKSTRPAFHSGPKTILPPEGKDAATAGKCSSSAPSNSGTETSQAACGWPKSPPTAPPPRTLRASKPPPIPTRGMARKPTAGPATLRSVRRSPQCPCRQEDQCRSPRPPWIHASLLQPQRMRREASTTGLRQASICRPISMSSSFSFNRRKTRHAAFRSLFRLATNAEPPYLQACHDRTGAMCISGSRVTDTTWARVLTTRLADS